MDKNTGDPSMMDLFRTEVETQSSILVQGLLALERGTNTAERLEELMRAAHSLKGAARIVGRRPAVRIAHAMEDCFVAAQAEKRDLSQELVSMLLEGVDLLNRISQVSDEGLENWDVEQNTTVEAFLASVSSLATVLDQRDARLDKSSQSDLLANASSRVKSNIPIARSCERLEGLKRSTSTPDRMLRVTAENLNHLMGLAGEALMASRWLDTFSSDMSRLKQLQHQFDKSLEALRNSFPPSSLAEPIAERLIELRDRAADCQRSLAERRSNLELFDRRFGSFTTRLYQEVLECRMRPFSDATQGFHRMVRDVARTLGKSVRLEIGGESTPVDRDILERLKSPLDHLLRNAIDHGIETPAERQAQNKPAEGVLQLQAYHSAGMLLITISDDGRGVDPETVRATVVRKDLTTLEMTQEMTPAELLDFLFLPGFTLKESVSEISGRGVGLDAVQTMVKEVGGRVRISSRARQGTRFQLELPLTLSVVRTLLVEIGGEPYAFPLARIDRAVKLPREAIESLEGRQHFALEGRQVGLVAAHQVLDLTDPQLPLEEIPIIVLGDKTARYGLGVDRFLGERELVVRTLDPRLGKVKNISSAALMPDGSPVLIVDMDDLMRSIETLVSGPSVRRIYSEAGVERPKKRKHVLVVDDSLTVRELERKLLAGHGYIVDVAVDGVDGWNSLRTGRYDLLVTDVDMPRLDGIELLRLIRKDIRLKSLPVMIVSFKDREQDRTRGLEAGADYYLTKASFQDETLVRVVGDLIGGPEG